jgi:arsenite methyltransferase
MRRRGDYGYDAPYALAAFAIVGIGALATALTAWVGHGTRRFVLASLTYGLFFSAHAASFWYTTRRGKFRVWNAILEELSIQGDERVLDLGCGRGAVTVAIASRLRRGTIVGVDRWSGRDQSGNSPRVTIENGRREGVIARLHIATADMRELPFADGSFDLIVSSLAIHNIPGAANRLRAIREALRVLKPGGRLAIADIRRSREYAGNLTRLGALGVRRRRLGWRFWYGNPFAGTSLVLASKPK